MKVDLKNIFEKRIKIEPKIRSILGVFFNTEIVEQTNYHPAYQRNYVWDDEKASYFIESIFLGTEIPPMIYFKTVTEDAVMNEIIDGRQRYESILRFVKGELKLKRSGLQRLSEVEELVGKTFDELDESYKSMFQDTNIRIIEYSFLGDHTPDEEDSVKKEIFQRYNSGITPLKEVEIDTAQYLDNDLNAFLKEKLKKDPEFDKTFSRLFPMSQTSVEQKVKKLRELLVLHKIPIKYYAIQKQKVIKKYFELLSDQISEDSMEYVFQSFKRKLTFLSMLERAFTQSDIQYNRLYGECICWALSVVEEETNEPLPNDLLDVAQAVDYFKSHQDKFVAIRSSFAQVLFDRYKCTADFFSPLFGVKFDLYLWNNDNFKKSNRTVSQKTEQSKPLSFDDLRINKPEPTSVEVNELILKIKSNRFLIRPSYQRGEVHNKKKSSSIIESLLLGIKLPPVFVFKRLDGVSEVIDGQQRLLSIIGFIGGRYKDENNEEQASLIDGFSLDLKDNGILKDLHGKSFMELTKADRNKIMSSDIWMIEISGKINKNFDPIDLFIRLNNKPYPIQKDSFEMWNSFANRSLIELIKSSYEHNQRWFYLRKNNARMDNENLLATLAYFQYEYLGKGIPQGDVAPDKTIEPYKMGTRIICRFRYRNNISKLMEQDDYERFAHAINTLEFSFITNVRELLSKEKNNTATLARLLDSMMHVENGRRTQMMFYVIWLLLHDLPSSSVAASTKQIRSQISEILYMMSDGHDAEQFKKAVLQFRNKYSLQYSDVRFELGHVAEIKDAETSGSKQYVQIVVEKNMTADQRYPATSVNGKILLQPHQIGINVNRPGVLSQYIEAYIRSRLFSYEIQKGAGKLTAGNIRKQSMPYIPMEAQEEFQKIIPYIDFSTGLERRYFERILDLMACEVTFPDQFEQRDMHICKVINGVPDLSAITNESERRIIISEIFREMSSPNNVMALYLMKSVDMGLDEYEG